MPGRGAQSSSDGCDRLALLGLQMPSEAVNPKADGVVHYHGMKFVFAMDEVWPVLKTVVVAR